MICSIVVLYEPEKGVLNNILSYYDSVDFSYILDNSRQSNLEEIKKVLKNKEAHYKYKHFAENVGLCRALNYGINQAGKLGCKWVLLMDSDSSFMTDIIKEFKTFLEANKSDTIAVLSPVHFFDRSKQSSYNGTKSMKWAMTSGCLYNVDVFLKLKGFKEELYVDGLDMDYCYKARENGYSIIQVGNAVLKHNPAQTKEIRFNDSVLFRYGYASPWRYYMQARSLVWTFLRYHHIHDAIIYTYKFVKVITLFDNKCCYISEMLRGSKDGFKLWIKQRSLQ